jgi:hypothetical protein
MGESQLQWQNLLPLPLLLLLVAHSHYHSQRYHSQREVATSQCYLCCCCSLPAAADAYPAVIANSPTAQLTPPPRSASMPAKSILLLTSWPWLLLQLLLSTRLASVPLLLLLSLACP